MHHPAGPEVIVSLKGSTDMSAVTLSVAGSIAELTLDNPRKLNALDSGMIASLRARLEQLDKDPGVRAVILTGSGDKAFCAGADIGSWAELSADEFAGTWVREGNRVFDLLARLTKPTIAALNGFALGGGLELCAACDIRIAHPGAFLALPEAGIGVAPCWSGTQRLAKLLPVPVLREMALFGRRIGADRAHDLGFIAELSDDPLSTARETASAAESNSRHAIEIAKSMISAAAGEDPAGAIDMLAGGVIAAHPDKGEGVAAFKGKRKPRFAGPSGPRGDA